ncbi:MAG TPA: hypothetical protein VEU11_10415 [Terriglobales bacterium]|jgi:plastocyanin|nr:hypothetical protein [Terriglobales bacterium]
MQDMKSEVLKVRIRTDLTLDYDVVNVRLSVGDEVEWVTEGGPITISFDGEGPFTKNSFVTIAGKPARSGKPVGKDGYYEYCIYSELASKSADPGVNVKP